MKNQFEARVRDRERARENVRDMANARYPFI